MTYSRLLFIALVALFVLRGCSSEPDLEPSSRQSKSVNMALPDFSSISTEDVYAYSCGDSVEFGAHVTPDSTWLFLADTTLKVDPVTSGSGAKFQASGYIYWSKGNEAILQKPTGSFLTCRIMPQKKSWQAARIRGVDFRALGQEPGWHLEITDGKQISYVGNYGEDTLVTPVPKPKMDGQRKVYRAETKSRTLVVEISDEPCTDRMSGFQFPSTVTATVDGETYRGCGRQLSPITDQAAPES